MAEYKKPVVVVNEDMAEGVYTDNSGAIPNCWTINVYSSQANAGDHHNFRISAVHSNDAVHISTDTTITIVFNQPVSKAVCEGFTTTVSGNTVTIVRASHGNSYACGDNFNCLLEVYGNNFEAFTTVSYTIKCNKVANVQGGMDY